MFADKNTFGALTEIQTAKVNKSKLFIWEIVHSVFSCTMPLGRPPSRLVTWGISTMRPLPLCATVPRHPGTVGPLALFNTQRTQLSKDELDLTFNDHRAAYKSKTTSQVARAYLVLTLCGIKPLVKNNDMVRKS